MNTSGGKKRTVPIALLLLIFTLMCSLSAVAQFLNNVPDTATSTTMANTSDNSSTLTITGVTNDATSATFNVVSREAQTPAANQLRIYVPGTYLNARNVKYNGSAVGELAGVFLISNVTSGTPTTITVSGTFATTRPAGTGAGTVQAWHADPVTGLPGQYYSGDMGCLNCHSMPVNIPNRTFAIKGSGQVACTSPSACGPLDANGYLLTGHKNMLRKVLPPSATPYGAGPFAPVNGMLGPDGNTLPSTDAAGNIYDWLNGLYTKVGGTAKQLYYLFGWAETPDILYPGGGSTTNYQCARCHTTGYRFDGLGAEPTTTTVVGGVNTYTDIPDDSAHLRRAPAGWSSSSSATSSWMLSGIQCERCHNNSHNPDCGTVGVTPPTIGGQTVTTCEAWKDANGVYHYAKPYQPLNVQATALCVECHRQERNDTTKHIIQPAQLPAQNLSGWPAIPGASSLGAVSDSGKCSDGSSTPYSKCTAAGLKWNFKPSMSHGANGAQAFLNSPHARFTGTLEMNAQNSPDLSVKLNGTFASYFTDWGEGLGTANGNNGGCTGCHNPHYSTVATTTPAPTPIVKHCQECHAYESPGRDYSVKAVNHPVGEQTPLPNGLSSSDSEPCMVCHMAGAGGAPQYHYFRINEDPNYYTFGPASTWYAKSDTPGNGQPNTYAAEGRTTYPAVGLDLDIVCGQCHVGGDGKTNTYGIATASTNAPVMTRAEMAKYAKDIHVPFMMTVPPSATGTKGKPLAINISVSPRLNGFFTPVTQSPVTMDVSGLPANATYSWAGNPVTPVTGGAVCTLTITVPATSAQLRPQQHSRAFLALFLPMFGIAMGSVVLGANKQKRIWVVLGLLVLVISLAGVGCGNNGTPASQSAPGTQTPITVNPAAPSFTITVTATAGSATSTTSSTIPVTMN